MNINEMSDQEKSAALGDVCGWMVVEFVQYYDYRVQDINENEIFAIPNFYNGGLPNLYDPANMALAWRVLNWAISTIDHSVIIQEKLNQNLPVYDFFENSGIEQMPPAEAQRTWLDKILELAIEAGIVNDET